MTGWNVKQTQIGAGVGGVGNAWVLQTEGTPGMEQKNRTWPWGLTGVPHAYGTLPSRLYLTEGMSHSTLKSCRR